MSRIKIKKVDKVSLYDKGFADGHEEGVDTMIKDAVKGQLINQDLLVEIPELKAQILHVEGSQKLWCNRYERLYAKC